MSSFFKNFFKNVFCLLQKTFIILSFLRMFVKKFFIFFKNFWTVYFVEIIEFVFLQDFYKFIISFIFCQELFYNFLTFNILKCLIVRLLLEKTFTILSSVLKLVNSFFIFFKNYFNSLFRWSCLYKTVIILAFLLSFVKVFLNITSLEILYCSSSLSEDFYYSIIPFTLCQQNF